MDLEKASAIIHSFNPIMQNLAKQYHEKEKERIEKQYLADNFGIYGEYCSMPYVYEYNPEFWAFHNWLVTHRTKLKTIQQVMRSLKKGIAVWRYKPE